MVLHGGVWTLAFISNEKRLAKEVGTRFYGGYFVKREVSVRAMDHQISSPSLHIRATMNLANYWNFIGVSIL